MTDLLAALLAAPAPLALEELASWWAATADLRAAPTTIDRALLGGAAADRLGFAFAAGYTEALQALVPEARGRLTSLCATEEGGAHPRAIRTALVADGAGGYRLTGRKHWSTAASSAAELLVIASTGHDETGRNRLRAVRVAADARGVRLTATSAAFVPEIPHAEVMLDDVRIAEADVLPGDGYADYLKPFRTLEDVHVHAALLGYLVGVARRHRLDASLLERALALIAATRDVGLRATAGHALAPSTHLALAGLLELVTAFVVDVEGAWASLGGAEHARWLRDRPLLRVASAARTARRDAARAALLAG
ncbi:MAG TPA: acyl-CoA dehydrogenase family protein [Kofleriaceae bacterium]|nr:acyl-CoA dehydrogenase family protein [Kofleriaceae bacterium]